MLMTLSTEDLTPSIIRPAGAGSRCTGSACRDLTEHHTDEGKLYLCAIKDVFSNRIVGHASDPIAEAAASKLPAQANRPLTRSCNGLIAVLKVPYWGTLISGGIVTWATGLPRPSQPSG